MEKGKQKIISDEEKEILLEIMNIAFGNATADLAEIINMQLILSVPDITISPMEDLSNYIKKEIENYTSISVVKQQFWGEFKGTSFLIFSSGSGKELVSLLQDQKHISFDTEPIVELEKETLLEIGNILIGACVGKISELLGDVVTYSPPYVIIEDSDFEKTTHNISPSDSTAIILKTLFHTGDRDISGILFLITSNESIRWLKNALHDFMKQYE